MHKVYLSRRNISTLLSKLDRIKNGEYSAATLIKCDNQHAKYPQTMEQIAVSAIEDLDEAEQKPDHIFLTRTDLLALTVMGSKIELGDVVVRSVDDAEYYSTRQPGFVLPVDDPSRKK